MSKNFSVNVLTSWIHIYSIKLSFPTNFLLKFKNADQKYILVFGDVFMI